MHAEATIGAPQRVNTNLYLTDAQRANEASFHQAAVALLRETCHICGCTGHDMFQCATLKNLNALAKAHGIAWEWGATKGAIYYEQWVANNPVIHMQQQLQKQ